MSKIVGRTEQKRKLDEILKSKSPEFVVIYGRRRVGKTFLIKEYYRDHIAFNFSGSFSASTSVQLDNFFTEYTSRTKSKIETNKPNSWTQAFTYLIAYLKQLKKRRKSVVFIDELPWLDSHKSGFVPAFEYFWNQHVSTMSHVLLVVCGSATSWIQKKLLKSKGGLYNRITQRIKLKPFNLCETEQYCQSRRARLSRYQIIQLYMVMGGVPHYLKEIRPGQSATQIIDNVCFSKDGLLRDEYNQLYHSIFNTAENHMAIIEALASKPQGILRNEIVKLSGLPDGGIITRTLEELEESGLISIVQPFNKKKRNSLYQLSDFYSHFYLKFIKPHNLMGKGTWEKLSRKQSYTSWTGYAFENICFQHIDQIKKSLGISGVYANCSSWKFLGDQDLSGTQIGLLIDRDDQVINICEAKFTKSEFLISKSYASNLRSKVNVFEKVTQTRKSIHTTLLTTYPAIRNDYYLEHVQSEVTMDDLFDG